MPGTAVGQRKRARQRIMRQYGLNPKNPGRKDGQGGGKKKVK